MARLYRPNRRNISYARKAAMIGWIARAEEYGCSKPTDLSNSCLFSSLMAIRIFGGELRGNYHHFHVKLDSGQILDINEKAIDVQKIKDAGRDPYHHDRNFFKEKSVRDQIESCRLRSGQWVDIFHEIRKSHNS